jgi:hypothetical protein
MSSSCFAVADRDVITSRLQDIAKKYAQELGSVDANETWTRVEFSKPYDEPIVVVEKLVTNNFLVGIRNVDKMGFEIKLQTCSINIRQPIQGTINFSVIEKGEVPTFKNYPINIKQQFAWDECSS